MTISHPPGGRFTLLSARRYLHSSYSWYPIILLGNRATCVWAACPRLLPGSGPAEIQTRERSTVVLYATQAYTPIYRPTPSNRRGPTVPWTQPEPIETPFGDADHWNQHDRFRRFCRVHPCDKYTDRQTDSYRHVKTFAWHCWQSAGDAGWQHGSDWNLQVGVLVLVSLPYVHSLLLHTARTGNVTISSIRNNETSSKWRTFVRAISLALLGKNKYY